MKYSDVYFPIHWSIYMPDQDDVEPLEDTELDIRTNMPDGVYCVCSEKCLSVRGSGVVVKDGHFDIYATLKAIYKVMKAVNQQVSDCFVVSIWYDTLLGCFVIEMES